jgi:hypothetical protein
MVSLASLLWTSYRRSITYYAMVGYLYYFVLAAALQT